MRGVMLEIEGRNPVLPDQNIGGEVTRLGLLKRSTQESLWHKVLVLLDRPDCQKSSFLIAEKIGSKIDDVLYALEAMEHLGWIKKDSGKYIRLNEAMKLDLDKILTDKSELEYANWLMFQQIIHSSMESNQYRLDYQFMLTDKELLSEYLKKKKELKQWFIEKSEHSKKDLLIEEAWVAGSTLKNGVQK